jgi:hypothetical protein
LIGQCNFDGPGRAKNSRYDLAGGLFVNGAHSDDGSHRYLINVLFHVLSLYPVHRLLSCDFALRQHANLRHPIKPNPHFAWRHINIAMEEFPEPPATPSHAPAARALWVAGSWPLGLEGWPLKDALRRVLCLTSLWVVSLWRGRFFALWFYLCDQRGESLGKWL